MNKLIKIISFSLISIFILTGCDPEISNNITEFNSGRGGNITINIEEGYKFVDIKVGAYSRTIGVKHSYVYTLTRKRKVSEKHETYKLDIVFDNGNGHGSLPKHITIIEN